MPAVPIHFQRGSALIVSLILLVALSLLGIASMNTASLDLIMAGNEQYRTRAFNAIEAGIERALATDKGNADRFNPKVPWNSGIQNIDTETYQVQITALFNGNPVTPSSGTSITQGGPNQYSMYVFNMSVDGTSSRGTNVRQVQGVRQIAPQPSGPPPLLPPAGGGPTPSTSLNVFSVTN